MAATEDIKVPEIVATGKLSDEETARTPDGEQPTEYERKTLRLVTDSIPLAAWLVCIVETAERFTYYCIAGPLQNYMQNAPGIALNPGVLGLGQATASSISYAWKFWTYFVPVPAAYIADSYLGRYRTICWAVALYMSGIVLLFATSTPAGINAGAAPAGFGIALFLIATGGGAIKPNVGVLIFEQYTETKQRIKTLKSGERVIVDPETTVTNIYLIYYNILCIGCLSGIPASYLRLRVGYWATFLLPLCTFWISVAALWFGRKVYVRTPPKRMMGKAFRAMAMAIRHGFNFDAAKPSVAVGRSYAHKITWDDAFVNELKRAMYACKVLLPQPIAWLCYLQATNNLVSQAGTMETHGLPNDILYNFQLILTVVLIFVFRKGVYPLLRRWHIPAGPIRKMTVGFAFGILATAWAAIVQHIIYSTGPCYDQPLACPESAKGTIPNRVHVMLQFPSYVGFALSEVMFSITSYEYAYTKAPKSMKSIVQAMVFITVAIASALGIAVSRAAKNPNITYMYAGLAVGYFLIAAAFAWICRGFDEKEYELFRINQKDTDSTTTAARDSTATTRQAQEVEPGK